MDYIIVRGAKVHNLKNITVKIPKNKLTVITGLSGSGKSSLALDTIYVEGQRRYLESLSSYARQFIGNLKKPEVESIEGLSPSIAIDQKSVSHNPRSTVGTVTEIYDLLRVLYAKIGEAYCYKCGRKLEKLSVDEIVKDIMENFDDSRIYVESPIAIEKKGTFKDIFEKLLEKGYARIELDGEVYRLEETPELNKNVRHNIFLIVDRLRIKNDENIKHRLFDSVEIALRESNGFVYIKNVDTNEVKIYSEKMMCPTCGVSMPEINPKLFSFNSPYGACDRCHGLGFTLEVDEKKVIDFEKPVLEAINIGHKEDGWIPQRIKKILKIYGGDLKTPFKDLPEETQEAILYGTTFFDGLIPIVRQRYEYSTSEDTRQWYLDKFFVENTCHECGGKRLRKEALSILIDGVNIIDFTELPISDEYEFIKKLRKKLSEKKLEIVKDLIEELEKRLQFLNEVGLSYISLSRNVKTLSGGEAQRIRLATQIGSGLTGVTYVLDEPTIGLHQSDNEKLISTLKRLRDLGNTVIVVEHDEDVIRSADYLIDIGPAAGINGGKVVYQGPIENIISDTNSLTIQYLKKIKKIEVPKERRKGNGKFLTLYGARHNNLKNINVSFPLGTFICVTGVSGSGKSSLIIDTLYPALMNALHKTKHHTGEFDRLEGLENIDKVIAIDQSPIGRTPRSNPATYTKVFDEIRKLFAMTPLAKARGYTPGRFSFNVKGGRCEHCQGQGILKVEMLFLPDVYVQCDVCNGKRYNSETLQITYKDKNIADILDMTVEEALEFFKNIPNIYSTLKVLYDVGLSYIKLGQPATTLSGGEAQRIKLASELKKRATGKTVYILDEPTVGLHFEDVKKLINVLNKLVDKGNTVIVIEHNLDVIKSADYVIDLGPEGGKNGGYIVAEGTPEDIANSKSSLTGKYIKMVLEGNDG